MFGQIANQAIATEHEHERLNDCRLPAVIRPRKHRMVTKDQLARPYAPEVFNAERCDFHLLAFHAPVALAHEPSTLGDTVRHFGTTETCDAEEQLPIARA